MTEKRCYIIALHINNKITYHYVESLEDIYKLEGEVLGKYPTEHFLQNEKAIQDYHKAQIIRREDEKKKN